MWHYIVNTSDIYDFSLKLFDDQLRLTAQSLAQQANLDCIIAEPLPSSFSPYSVLVVANPGFAHFNVYCAKELVSVNIVCWSEVKQKSVWGTVEEQLLELTREYSGLSICSLKYPNVFPWITTLKTPNPKVLALWLNDFEQCLATALVEADQLSVSAI